jgi:O-methyltransferase involved in polyketide biosynthesis/acyl-coenzyme A thioesterase PaaI-like protein
MDWITCLESQDAWSADKLLRFNEKQFTQAFHKSVPVLSYLDWKIEQIDRGYCRTLLPINVECSNQYITQQAALMLLAADYTGGIALCTLFNQVPVIGFHSQTSDYGAYMWGAKSHIKWHQPSSGDLTCVAQVDKKQWQRLANRFFNGQKVITEIPVFLYNDQDELVAQVEFTYWAWDSYSLRNTGRDLSKTHILFKHKIATSAKLIAGLRSLCADDSMGNLKLNDPYAAQIAGKQGVVLARKFCLDTPELKNMVAARTLQLNHTLEQYIAYSDSKFNIVNIGVGLDTRFLNFKSEKINCFYELDLPIMLQIRQSLLPQGGVDLRPVKRLPLDLRDHTILASLRAANIDFNLPIFLIWEGCSMYFNETDSQKIFDEISKITFHKDSVAWFDYVNRDIICEATGIKAVDDFLFSMRRMGEPFINGYEDFKAYSKNINLAVHNITNCADYIDNQEAIYQKYHFCMVKGSVELGVALSDSIESLEEVI